MTLYNSSPDFLNECRAALASEQSKSLAETNNWSHVDKAQVHLDWETLYKELALLIDKATPVSPEVQSLMRRHAEIGARFYPPSRKAYIGLGLFYSENIDMKNYHNAYHPKMVEFLGEAIFYYANANLTSST